MIIYGSKATHLASEKIREQCPNCHTAGNVEMSTYQKYAHVFWIPLFPMAKTGATECTHCKQVLQKKEMPDSFRISYADLESRSKTPLWTFSGLVLVALLITWGTLQGKQNDEKNAGLITAPQKGDVYEIKKAPGQFTLYKVEEVAGDTVHVLLNEYESNMPSGLDDIRKKGDEAYMEETVPFTKSDLKTMLEKGEIRDIERK